MNDLQPNPDSASRVVASEDLRLRTRLIQGAGTIGLLGGVARPLGCRRALMVTDPGIVAAGHVARAVKSLSDAGLEVEVFDGARENPSTVEVELAVATARRFRPDLLIGLGGGSSLDTAKGANFILAGGGSMQDYWGTGKGRGTFLPLIGIPTTAGTGSELQSYALISDARTKVKMACGDPLAACVAAILDPELTLTQPAAITALTGIDAISHAIESWVCTRRNPFSAMFSREAFRLLARAFRSVLERPDDLAARTDMQLGAAWAGAAIENSMLGAAHAMANPLTARFGMVHGQAVGITLPAVIRFNSRAVDGWYRELLLEIGLDLEPGRAAGPKLAEWMMGLVSESGLATDLSGLELTDAAIAGMADEAARQWTAGFNPLPVDAAAFRELYRSLTSPSGATRRSSDTTGLN